MNINIEKIKAAAAIARTKAQGNAKWIRAIERAAAGLLDGSICVTLFCDGYALVTTATGQHWVNGICSCTAAQHGHTQCVHRAAKRLVEMIEETAHAHTVPGEWLEGQFESVPQTFCKPDEPETAPAAVTLADDVAASTRANLIAEITNIWPRFSTTPLAVELMARFGKNKLEMLDDDMLRRVRLAIAM